MTTPAGPEPGAARLVVAKAPAEPAGAPAEGSTLLALGTARSAPLQVFPLDRPETTIGRQSACEIPLRHFTVSRRHARVLLVDGTHWLEDLGSANGVRVNGVEVERHRLAANDRLRIGQFELVYLVG